MLVTNSCPAETESWTAVRLLVPVLHAIHALKQGVDVYSVQKRLGHANLFTPMRYLDLIDDDVKDAYKAF